MPVRIDEGVDMSDSNAGWMVGLIIAGVIWYGISEHRRVNDLQEKLDAAHSQIDDLKEKAQNLQDASDNLKQQMDRFETENWRDVVGDAKSAASDVDDAQGDLKESADNADGSK
jgi:TolA-binding protein